MEPKMFLFIQHWHSFLSLLLLFSATTAQADIAASYANAEHNEQFLVEISNDGAMRFTDKDGSYILILGEQAYSVEAGPGAPVVQTAELINYQAREAARKGEIVTFSENGTKKPGPIRYEPGVKLKISGYDGSKYTVPGTEWASYTLSTDPSLLPLGKAFAAYFKTIDDMSPDEDENAENIGELLATHGVLEYWQRQLVSVSFDSIDPKRFVLPAIPQTVADFKSGVEEVPSAKALNNKRQASIIDAQYHGQTLLVLRDDGKMEAWAEGATESKPFEAPGAVGTFCQSEQDVFLATRGKKINTVNLWSGQPAAWSKIMMLAMDKKDSFVALDCTGDEPLLLTTGTLHFLKSGKSVTIRSQEPWLGGFLKTLQHGGYLYVGANAGEWGGGLRRIPLSGGEVESIDGSDSAELCGGLLNAKCAPVTGLAVDPMRSSCILATTGLVHMLPSGSVVRVCDGKISLAYAKPYTLELGWKFDPDNYQNSMSSVPFYSANSNGNSDRVWAVASDGLYEFTDGALPAFTAYSGNFNLPVSGIDWSNPNFVLISTNMNQRHSLSGNSLILIPR
jgi:hypothetical protein